MKISRSVQLLTNNFLIRV